MKGERAIFIENYITLYFNGGTEIIYLNNHEVRRDVDYVPSFAPEIYEAENGKSFARKRPQQEYLRFNLEYNKAESRTKYEKIRRQIQNGYTLALEFDNAIVPFDTFPFEDATDQEEHLRTQISFGVATIRIPQDFSFDRSGRGQGAVKIDEIEIIIYNSATLPPPSTSCSSISLADFAMQQWFIDALNSNEILGIDVELASGSLIASLDVFGPGIVTGSNLTGPGSSGFTMTHNGTRYVPDTGPEYLSGTYEFQATINVTTTSGDPCTIDFEQTLYFEANNTPVVVTASISGKNIVGNTVVGTATITDDESDPIDTTPADTYEWYSFLDEASALAGVGGTFIGQGASYTLQAAEEMKYVNLKVKPYATSGASPGVEVWSSNAIGCVAPATFTRVRTQDLTLNTILLESAQAACVTVDWGDNTCTDWEATGAGDSQQFEHTYSGLPAVGYYDIKIHANPNAIKTFQAFTQDFLEVDISTGDALENITVADMPNLTLLDLPATPTATLEDVNIFGLDLITELDFSNYTGLGTSFRVYSMLAMTNVLWPAVGTTTTTLFRFQGNTAYTSAIDLSGHDVGTVIQTSSTPATDLIITVSSTPTKNLTAFAMDLTGTLDLTVLDLTNIVLLSNNINLTDVLLSANTIKTYSTSSTGILVLDASTLTSLTFANWQNMSSLTSIITPPSTGTITQHREDQSTNGYTDLTNFTFSSAADIRLQNKGMTAAEVNQTLFALYNALPQPGTGSIRLEGNSPPDNTSGGAQGIILAGLLASAGYTITTA